MLENLLSFAISLLIGLLIGIERERSHLEGIKSIGVRTFTLFALLGTLTAVLNQPLLTVIIGLFVFGIILLSYYRSSMPVKKNNDLGITTELAAGIIFCLGFLTPTAPLLAIIISAIVFLVLIERKRLHTLARKKFRPQEIEAAIILIVFALGIIPALPNRAIDPWNLFNPRDFGLLMATIASIQFAGYLAIKLFGERFGLALTGFLGGLVSSTVVFASLKQTLDNHTKFHSATIASALLAISAMILEIMAIVFVASPSFLFAIIWPMLVMLIIGLISSGILLHYQKIQRHTYSPIANPLNILSILRTSIFIAVTLIMIVIAKRYVGEDGVLVISFLGGLFEIHGISLATSLLYLQNQLSIQGASFVLYTAILASFISKFFLLWTLTPRSFAKQTSLFMLGVLVSGWVTFWIMIKYS